MIYQRPPRGCVQDPFASLAKSFVARPPNGAQSVARWRHSGNDLASRSPAENFGGRSWRRFAVGHSRMAVRRTRGHSRRELVASRVKQVEKLLDVSPAGYRYQRRVRGRRSGACRPPSSGWNWADRRVRSACATVAIFFRAGMWRAIKQCDPVISTGAAGVRSEAVNARVAPRCPGPGGDAKDEHASGA
jgi:hypothetical protein